MSVTGNKALSINNTVVAVGYLKPRWIAVPEAYDVVCLAISKGNRWPAVSIQISTQHFAEFPF